MVFAFSLGEIDIRNCRRRIGIGIDREGEAKERERETEVRRCATLSFLPLSVHSPVTGRSPALLLLTLGAETDRDG